MDIPINDANSAPEYANLGLKDVLGVCSGLVTLGKVGPSSLLILGVYPLRPPRDRAFP